MTVKKTKPVEPDFPDLSDLETDLKAAEKAMLEREKLAHRRLADEEEHRFKEAVRRIDARKSAFAWITGIVVTAAILFLIVWGCKAWYDHSYEKNAAKWMNWRSQCAKAGGDAVGERYGLVCYFPSGAQIPYSSGER